MPLEEARKAGAMALFGEKYEDSVRVVTAGDISMELCGGCHVERTGHIGFFKVLSESSVAAGIRRIEAVCGEAAVDAIQRREAELAGAAQLLTAPIDGVRDRVETLLEENKRLAREVQHWKQQAATGGGADFGDRITDVNGVKLLATEVPGQDPKGLRLVVDKLREKVPSGVVVAGSAAEGKVALCVSVSKDLTDRVRAGDMVRELAPIVGGGGGGRPDMAQAGGKDPGKLPDAIARAPELLQELLEK
jgi:alanyl-tRNA synthetase